MKMAAKFIFLIMIIFTFGQPASAEEIVYPNYPAWTPEGLMEFTYQAFEYIQETGDILEFQKQGGKFTKGSILDYRFIAIADCKTFTLVVQPWLPVVGKVGLLRILKDAKGELFGKRHCRLVKKSSGGVWVRLHQTVPGGGNKITPLGEFAIPIEGTPFVIFAMARGIDLSEKKLNELTKTWLAKRKKTKLEALWKKLEESAKQAKLLSLKQNSAKKK